MEPDICMADSHSGTDGSVRVAAYQHTSNNVDGSMDEPTLTERPDVGFATWTCISSDDIDSMSMVDSVLTMRPTSLHEPSWNPLSLSHRSTHPAQFFDHPTFEIRLATPPAHIVPSVSFSEDSWDSSIQSTTALQSEHSTTSSSTDPPESHCDIEGCSTVFSGVHRKGNLSRHKRLKHSDRVYVCEDASCGRVFNRQDARLKHYRKYHLRLASPYLARPLQRQLNRERYPDS
jgi:hypothetical protein